MKNKVLLVMTMLMTIITLTACRKSNSNADIISFDYSYGSFHSGYHMYSINMKNGEVTFKASGYNGVDLDVNKKIDKSYLERLSQIINDNNINEWNGFDERDENVLDGYSFSLRVVYDNGKNITSSGYMKYPKDYKKGHQALVDFLNEIK